MLSDQSLAQAEDSTLTTVSFPFKVRQAEAKWERLVAHLEDVYHEPDLEGVRIAAAAAAAHSLWDDASPIWLMLVGASGTGKSSLVGSVVSAFPSYYALSNLTPATLMSGWGKGKKGSGLLLKLGSSILFWISDFSSITGMREDKRAEIASQLREVYDGRIAKDFGIEGRHVEWTGKATVLVGCTRTVERMWGLQRELGERFLYLRWKTGNPESLALKAGMQDREKAERDKTTELTAEWIGDFVDLKRAVVAGSLNEMERLGLQKVAALVAKLRTPVIRDRSDQGAGQIVDIADSEGPGRIMKTLYLMARANATLARREGIEKEDVKLSLRIAKESIPYQRWRILETLRDGNKSMAHGDIRAEWEKKREWTMSVSTLARHLEEMTAIGGLEREELGGQNWYSTTEWVKERIGVLQ